MPILFDCVFNGRCEVSAASGIHQSALGITISPVARHGIADSSAAAGWALGFPTFRFSCCLLIHRLEPIGISTGASGKLIVGVDQRLSKRGVEVTQDVQNLEEGVLAVRGEADFARVTGGTSTVWPLGGLSHNRASYGECLLCRKLCPEMSIKPHEIVALVMRIEMTPSPCLDRVAEKHHSASGGFGAVRIEVLKHIADDSKWERGRVAGAKHIVERSLNMTVSEHVQDNVGVGKSFGNSQMPGHRDVSQQLRRYRRRDCARFLK